MTDRWWRGIVMGATVLLTTASAGCSGGGETSVADTASRGFPMAVSSCGRPVTIERPLRRVLTVASVAAPLVAAAGGADKIVARTFETASFLGEYADELAGVPLVSRTKELAREEIIARDPDLVLTFEGSDNDPVVLHAAGIDVLVSRGYCLNTSSGDFGEIFSDIELLGRLLGTPDVAAREVTRLRQRVDAVARQSPAGSSGQSAAALIFGRDTPTIAAYGDRSTVDQQMRVLGLRNVFGDIDKRTFEPTVEEIITRDPSMIILLTQGEQSAESARKSLVDKPELAGVTAIRNDDIVVLPFGYTGPGPVAVEGLEVMARQLGKPN